MISVVLMAALATAPDANANVFKRGSRHHGAPACCGAPAPCNDCGAPAPCNDCAAPSCCGDAAPAPAPAPVDGKGPVTPPAPMPKGDKADVKVEVKKTDVKVEVKPAPKVDDKKPVEKKAEAPIDIPAPLKAAIDKSDQKAAIMEYLNNTAVSREERIRYLDVVRQTLLPDEKKK